MSALSTHLVNAYTGLINPSASPPFASTSQSARNQPTLVISGPMSYNSAMHGSFNAYPPFSQQHQPLLGTGYNANALQQTMSSTCVDLPAQTAQQIAALQAKLNKKLGPEYISQRPGPSGQGKLTYAEGWKIINLANEVFGFNGWSSSITSLAVDYIDFNEQTQRYCVGVTAIVKVTLRDGVYHEDVGFGMLDNCRQKGMALDKCKKEAVTDALKRTLRNFGNLLGNCLYDKEYTKEVVKIQVPPPKFDRSKLHRRPECADLPTGSTSATGPSNGGVSNMGPPPTVPVRTLPPQSGLPPRPQPQAQQSLQQIGPRPQQISPVGPIVPQPQPQRVLVAPANPAPAVTGGTSRSGILAALNGLSSVSGLSPLPPTNALLQPQPAAQAPPAQVARQQSHPHQMHPPQPALSKPQLKKEVSQEEFPDFAEGDDLFYNNLNLESFDVSASTTLVDALGLVPSPPLPPLSTVPLNTACPRPAATATDVKGKGRMDAIMSGLTDDSPQPDRSFGIGPPPAYTSPVPPPRTTSCSATSGGAAGKGAQSGAGGFVIPAGVARPNRSGPPPHPSHTAGVKRSAGDAFTSGKPMVTWAPGVGGNPMMDRTVLGALEVGSDGAVLKRVRR